MHLAWGDEEEAFRNELCEFLDAQPTDSVPNMRNFYSNPEAEVLPDWARKWQAHLFDNGWMVPGYPPELGGRNATQSQTLIFLEELSKRSLPRSVHFPGYAIAAPSLLEFGTESQKAMAPAAIRGDDVWCIGMSEPNAGSDLGSLSTKAEVDGDHFVVNGQKVWTSYAMVADYCLTYVRTDPNAPKHRGISALIIPVTTPGVEIRPIAHLSGSAEFAEVFFTDARVPVENLVGDLNDGWRITMGSLAHERGGLWVEGVARLETMLQSLADLVVRTGRQDDPVVRRALGKATEETVSLRALGYKGFSGSAQGMAPEHSYMKLASSEGFTNVLALGVELLDHLGPMLDPEVLGDDLLWSRVLFASFAGTIAGGTSDIQRNIIAQRVLGLPRA